jgi:terminase small subunit / prophage DNA-packing protein
VHREFFATLIHLFTSMTMTDESLPPIRQANKAQAAEFFGISLPTLDGWIRDGAPVVQRGSRGVGWLLDLRAMADWVYSEAQGDGQTPELKDARARLEHWKAELAEQEFKKRAGELLDRAQVEKAAATVLATIAQTLRSIPDNLERMAGISAEQAEACEKIIDGICMVMHDRLKALSTADA